MSDESRIEERIQQILAGSGLPVERRAEVAEEFRGHLEQMVQARRVENADDAAIEAALAAFGEPDVIRRQLRRRQGAEDHRAVRAAMRKRLRSLLIIPALFPAYIAAFATIKNGQIFPGLLFAVIFYAVLLAGGFVVLYPFLLACIRARHKLPVQECHLIATVVGWFSLFTLSIVLFVLIFTCGIIAAFGAIFLFRPFEPASIHLARFSRDFLRDFVPNAGPLLLAVSGLSALTLAGIQRWRCVPQN